MFKMFKDKIFLIMKSGLVVKVRADKCEYCVDDNDREIHFTSLRLPGCNNKKIYISPFEIAGIIVKHWYQW